MRYTITPDLAGDLFYDWQFVSERFDDPYVDPRMIAAVQSSLAAQARFWNVIVYDEDDHPAAIACFFSQRADAFMMAPSKFKRAIRFARRAWPGLFRLQMLFCGLPASAGWNQLRIRPGADTAAVLAACERAQQEVCREARPRCSVLMEFDDEGVTQVDSLASRGYARADSPPMYVLPAKGRTFEEYVQAMKSHYRMIVTGAERKFARSPFRVVNISGGAAFLEVFTDEMYQLYVNVVAHADIVMHVLPAEYFCAIARHFGEQFLSTIVYRGEKPVAFAVGIVTKEAYYGLFIGLDYTAKQEADLYFNLFYETLRYAMRRRVRHVYMGSDSDRFKLRLGCRRENRSVFIRLHGLLDRPFRRTKRWWLPPLQYADHEMDVFRAESADAPNPAGAPWFGAGATPAPIAPRISETN